MPACAWSAAAPVSLDLEDNGIGFDPTVGSDGAIGLGIQSMSPVPPGRGSLSIERLGRGTLVRSGCPSRPPVICQQVALRCRDAVSENIWIMAPPRAFLRKKNRETGNPDPLRPVAPFCHELRSSG